MEASLLEIAFCVQFGSFLMPCWQPAKWTQMDLGVFPGKTLRQERRAHTKHSTHILMLTTHGFIFHKLYAAGYLSCLCDIVNISVVWLRINIVAAYITLFYSTHYGNLIVGCVFLLLWVYKRTQSFFVVRGKRTRTHMDNLYELIDTCSTSTI